MRLARAGKESNMSRYVKRPCAEPTSEEFIALFVLLGPLAWVVRWIWRGFVTRGAD
jgi:hypothetical protein